MDLYAYANIGNLEQYLKDNGISIPRLRGLQLCKEMEPFTEEEIKLNTNDIIADCIDDACASNWYFSGWYCYGRACERLKKKYTKQVYSKTITCIDGSKTDIYISVPKWEKIHGKHRKALKFEIKQRLKQFETHRKAWDKYCGREDVIRIHSRIGGANWIYYDGPQIVASHPLFLEKVDDAWDCTYCNIYMKIKEV